MRALLCVLCAALVAPIAGARAMRRDAPAPPAGPLSPLLVQALRLDPASVRALGAFTTRSGGRFDVAFARRTSGAECLVAIGYGHTGSGCGGLFARGPVAFLETGSGGPALEARSDLEVVGLARPSVARVAVVDTLGRTRWPALNENWTFVVEFAQAELAAGVGPAELVAYDRSGRELMRADLSEPP
jgi:hypothetical protein